MNGEAVEAAPIPIPEETPIAAVAVLTPEARRLRLCELALVVGVGFLSPTVFSLIEWLKGAGRTPETDLSSLHRLLSAAIAISVLAYVLHRQGRSLRTIGVTARASDLALCLVLWLLARTLAGSVAGVLDAFGVPRGPSGGSETANFLTWLSVVPSAAMEELIVRAYLMTEIAELSGSMAAAVLASVAFQCSYHLYQGVWAMLYHVGTFFVFAVFYAYTRRATPGVLAHALENFAIMAG